MRAVLLAMAVAGLLLLAPAPAQAHDAGTTLITVAPGRDTVQLTAQIPLSRIDFAYHTELNSDPQRTVPEQQAWLTRLVADRVTLTDPDGAAWGVTVDSVAPDYLQGFNTARVTLTATPPAGTRTALADLRWTVVNDVVYTHKVFIGENGLAGLITRQQPVARLTVEPLAATEPVSFASMLRTGFEHFREGPDHLLFLCMVALTAARRRARPATTLRRLALLTAMFTVGHSLSLACATLGWVNPPSRWVETGIAITIGLAAVHALRPTLSARAELAITAAFGLIHGFGFAGTLHELTLSSAEIVKPLLGFNLGLEAAQLLGLALLAVPLWIVARSSAASAALAVAAGAFATCWILQRAFLLTNPLESVAGTVLGTPERFAATLLSIAILVLMVNGIRARHQAATPQI